MSDIIIRKSERAGHITLNRPQPLNALTWEMCLEIERAIDAWRGDTEVALILIDGAGDKAFCAGGDIAEMYATGKRGDYDYGRRFWRDEYRLNAKLAHYPKPIVSFLHGFTMGGGVGVGCHASHRIVCDSSRIAMPECSIGLVPDVGGSLLLARAPGYTGEYLGLTAERMDAGDAIHAGFADTYVDAEKWDRLKARLSESGQTDGIAAVADPAPPSQLAKMQDTIDGIFNGATLADIDKRLNDSTGPASDKARKALSTNAPLAMAVALEIIRAVREQPDIRTALDHEFRYTYRCAEQGDFIEGIRAAIIDRDRNPRWRHQSWQEVPASEIAAMTAPLGDAALQWEDET